tara:strand:- start:670 stop:2229 length:1560 start_codon:yes stop_codon:yes gene_type:complete
MQTNIIDKPSSILYPFLSILVIYLCCFHNIWLPPISDVDEGAFSQATMEMIASDDYLSVTLLGEYRSDKPVLTHWLQSLSVNMFGANEMALRLPSSIAASLWLLCLGFFAARNFSLNHAYLTIIISGSCLGIMAISRAATADALFNLFLVLTICLYYQHTINNSKLLLYLASAFAGLGFLTKGPAAIIIPALLFITYSIFNSSFRKIFIQSLISPLAWLIFISFALPWYLLIYLTQGWEQFKEFFVYHNYTRFTQPLEGHDGGMLNYFFYFPVLVIFVIPYLGLLKDSLLDFNNYKLKSIGLFLLFWFLIVFIIFSIAATKLPHYLLYGLSPLFILFSSYALKKGSSIFIIFQTFIMIVFYFTLPFILYYLSLSQSLIMWSSLSDQVFEYFNYKYYLLMIIILTIYLYMAMNNNFNKWTNVSLSSVSLLIIFSFLVYPNILGLLQDTQKNIGIRASKEQGDLVFYNIYNPSVSFYSGKTARRGSPLVGDVVYTKVEDLENLSNYEIIYEENGQVLVRMN